MKVLILKKYGNTVHEIIKESFPSEWEISMSDPEGWDDLIGKADILIPSQMKAGRELLQKAEKLKVIQTGAGYDNVDLEYCRERGIRVMNAPAINCSEVAEHTFAFIFQRYKKIMELDSEIRKDLWSKKKVGRALSDLSIGIVGYGNIGRRVSEIASVFNMKVYVYSAYSEKWYRKNIHFTDTLDELLAESDIVTLHTSAGREKYDMISDREFSLMKKDAFLINTARGALVDEDALCRALDSRKISGAALDVFKEEPLPSGSRLRNYSNIIMTPHNAGEPDLDKSYRKRFEFFCRNIITELEGGEPEGVIV